MTLLAVVTTVATREDALRIGRSLIEHRLAACVQISAIESLYVWQGSVQHEPEFRVVAKTTTFAYARVEAAIREMHGYELPAIYAVPVERALDAYADWVAAGSNG